MSVTLDVDPLDLVDAGRYQRRGCPQEQWARLRAEAPVAYFEAPGFPAFWAITKHADLVQVASQPQIFSSAKGITLDRNEEEMAAALAGFENLVSMDPPRHGPMRSVANKEFLRSAVRARFDEIGRIAAEIVAARSPPLIEGRPHAPVTASARWCSRAAPLWPRMAETQRARQRRGGSSRP